MAGKTSRAKMGTPNKTAEAAAAVRAVHCLHEQSVIFDDPYAIHLTGSGWRMLARSRWFYRIGVRKMFKVLRPVHGQILARSRYTEERLVTAMTSGIGLYVILAAGFDSFALRRPDSMPDLKIYELDHPGTQRLKRDRIQSTQAVIPKNLEYLPVNFEQETVADVLANSSFDQNQPAFFSWLGTTPYLTREAVNETLKAISESCASGTELIFDYANTRIAPEDQIAVDRLKQFTERRGERLITQFDAETFPDELNNLGYNVIENISQADWRIRYYDSEQIADLRPPSVARIIHVRVR